LAEGFEDWNVPPEARPEARDYDFNLERALSSVVALTSRVPSDAFTAPILGTERAGNGVLIRDDGLILTIGYLVTEAEEVLLTTNTGRTVPGHVLDYDQSTGFGLVQALGDLDIPALPIGDSRHAVVGEQVITAGAGGRAHAVAARIVARQEFAGYWEYVLDGAIFTTPAHPHWGGAALIGPGGDLLGVGSLQVAHPLAGGRILPLNMIVPIELLPPLDDLLSGRVVRPARPWLGVYAQEVDGAVIVAGFAGEGPARRAGLREGDVIMAVAGSEVTTLADFYRSVWALGEAGVEAPLTLNREGDVFDVTIKTWDRRKFLKKPRLH
jgi:S1-C subfamily serine protease